MSLFSAVSRTSFAAILAAAMLPALGAETGSITLENIKNGQKIGTPSIHVTVSVSNFQVECKDAGKPGVPGRGHIHAMLDGMDMAHLTNFYCSTSFEISGSGLKPGKHVLAVTLSDDAHMMVGKPAMATFTYAPEVIRPLPAPKTHANPSLQIVSPKPGATLGKRFSLVLAVNDLALSCDLEGKPDVRGYGHLHVFVTQHGITDAMSATPKRPGMESAHSMSMVGMIGMPCTTTVPVDLSAWKSGKANVMVMLANNDHMPVMGTRAASVAVRLK